MNEVFTRNQCDREMLYKMQSRAGIKKRQPEGHGGSDFGKKSSKGKAVGMEREGHLEDISKVTMEMYRSQNLNLGCEI